MLKFKQYVNEIADLKNPYDYTSIKSPREGFKEFTFVTKNNRRYSVILDTYENETSIDFGIKRSGGGVDWNIITNDKDFRAFDTIFTIVKNGIENDKKINTISYSPSKEHENDKRREKIYMYYINKYFDVISSEIIKGGPSGSDSSIVIKIKR